MRCAHCKEPDLSAIKPNRAFSPMGQLADMLRRQDAARNAVRATTLVRLCDRKGHELDRFTACETHAAAKSQQWPGHSDSHNVIVSALG